ncbi:unnamed protein product [Moneuplotes crassus]|uniref:Uncharacterized protein n=1 Tax=Euplotes crassus TaxID=5936 RepID=A0AAD1UAP3_EUPCR|nr:unnamed protein product [Moneuplotes crassus]
MEESQESKDSEQINFGVEKSTRSANNQDYSNRIEEDEKRQMHNFFSSQMIRSKGVSLSVSQIDDGVTCKISDESSEDGNKTIRKFDEKDIISLELWRLQKRDISISISSISKDNSKESNSFLSRILMDSLFEQPEKIREKELPKTLFERYYQSMHEKKDELKQEEPIIKSIDNFYHRSLTEHSCNIDLLPSTSSDLPTKFWYFELRSKITHAFHFHCVQHKICQYYNKRSGDISEEDYPFRLGLDTKLNYLCFKGIVFDKNDAVNVIEEAFKEVNQTIELDIREACEDDDGTPSVEMLLAPHESDNSFSTKDQQCCSLCLFYHTHRYDRNEKINISRDSEELRFEYCCDVNLREVSNFIEDEIGTGLRASIASSLRSSASLGLSREVGSTKRSSKQSREDDIEEYLSPSMSALQISKQTKSSKYREMASEEIKEESNEDSQEGDWEEVKESSRNESKEVKLSSQIASISDLDSAISHSNKGKSLYKLSQKKKIGTSVVNRLSTSMNRISNSNISFDDHTFVRDIESLNPKSDKFEKSKKILAVFLNIYKIHLVKRWKWSVKDVDFPTLIEIYKMAAEFDTLHRSDTSKKMVTNSVSKKIKTTGKTVKVEKLPKECINKFEVKIGKATKRILSGNEHEENVIRIVSRLSKNILQTEEEINKNYVQASEEEKAEKYVWKFTFEEDLHKSNPIDFSSIFNQMGDYWILKDCKTIIFLEELWKSAQSPQDGGRSQSNYFFMTDDQKWTFDCIGITLKNFNQLHATCLIKYTDKVQGQRKIIFERENDFDDLNYDIDPYIQIRNLLHKDINYTEAGQLILSLFEDHADAKCNIYKAMKQFVKDILGVVCKGNNYKVTSRTLSFPKFIEFYEKPLLVEFIATEKHELPEDYKLLYSIFPKCSLFKVHNYAIFFIFEALKNYQNCKSEDILILMTDEEKADNLGRICDPIKMMRRARRNLMVRLKNLNIQDLHENITKNKFKSILLYEMLWCPSNNGKLAPSSLLPKYIFSQK